MLAQYRSSSEWTVLYEYDLFDVGIDYMLIILEKDGIEITFGWTNWFEGEIECPESMRVELESYAGRWLKEGEPEALTPNKVAAWKQFEDKRREEKMQKEESQKQRGKGLLFEVSWPVTLAIVALITAALAYLIITGLS